MSKVKKREKSNRCYYHRTLDLCNSSGNNRICKLDKGTLGIVCKVLWIRRRVVIYFTGWKRLLTNHRYTNVILPDLCSVVTFILFIFHILFIEFNDFCPTLRWSHKRHIRSQESNSPHCQVCYVINGFKTYCLPMFHEWLMVMAKLCNINC